MKREETIRGIISPNDTEVMRLADESTLGFTAEYGVLGSIDEARSCHFEPDALDIQSGVNLGSATLTLLV
ncbi:MAG: hypothetical protein ACU0C9_13010 [Paracoccaceae bacterium]